MVERTSYFDQIGGLACSPLLTGNTLVMFPISTIDFLNVSVSPVFGHNVIYSIIVANPQFPLKLLLLLTKISTTFHNESFVLIKEIIVKDFVGGEDDLYQCK